MCYGVVSATIPCLRIFLQAASAGRLGGGIVDPSGTQLATAGGSYKLSILKSGRSGPSGRGEDGMQLTSRRLGETVTQATRGGGDDKISVASDSSQRAIMVRQTFRVEHGRESEAAPGNME